MFPHIPLNTITVDLSNTQSISHTVDNILNGVVSPPSTSPLGTPLSTTTSPPQVIVSTRTPPVSDVPTSSATVKPIDQEYTTPDKVEEFTEPDTSGHKSFIPTKTSTDRVSRQDSGVGFSDSDVGLRKRTSATVSSSQMVGESSSSRDVSDVKTGYVCGNEPLPHGIEKDNTRHLTNDSVTEGEEQQPALQEDAYLTLQQRKKNMLQAAKRRYLQNHPGSASSFPPSSL